MADRFHLADLFEEVVRTVPDRLASYKMPKALIWMDEVRCSRAGKQDCRWGGEVVASAT